MQKFDKNGLKTEDILALQAKYGKNELREEKKPSLLKLILEIAFEPMFLLLIIASTIYFILQEPIDGTIMLIFISAVMFIEIFQEWKTGKSLRSLKDLTSPHIKVTRDNKEINILSSDLVPGDIMHLYEGVKIPADGFIIKCSDLLINESALTGESEAVWKKQYEGIRQEDYWKNDYCYAGTYVQGGSALIYVDKIGFQTEYGKIGLNLKEKKPKKSPLQNQINHLVKICSIIAVTLFMLVIFITFFNLSGDFKNRISKSILGGITLSMAVIPEEFPVVMSVFLSMGALRLSRKNSLVKKLSAVETLGSISVLCVDKTGTITANKMQVTDAWCLKDSKESLCQIAKMACEMLTYDEMEKAIVSYCDKEIIKKDFSANFTLIHEYPFTAAVKMMGHIWQNNKKLILAAKGSCEEILNICYLSAIEHAVILEKANTFYKLGYRVIALGSKVLSKEAEILSNLNEFSLDFEGLICLSDPPRPNVKNDIEVCKKAGIKVVMITGDNGLTAQAIGLKIGMNNVDKIITGKDLEEMSDMELQNKALETGIFSRVIPNHKMRIIKAFQENEKIVAMTGDGVNDALALKHADIGIAMGDRGSEIARDASDLILLDDNFSTIVDTIKDGRRIYANIQKSIAYILAIHIPIALSALLAPFLKLDPSTFLLLPLHVMLLELIIDPTCSIVLERIPAETEIMNRPPREKNSVILTKKIFVKSLIQGFVIFLFSFGIYYINLQSNPEIARSMGFGVLIFSNLFLVQINSHNSRSVFLSLKIFITDKVILIINIIALTGFLIILYTPINNILKLAPLKLKDFLLVVSLAALGTFWYEIIKLFKKSK